METSLTKIFLIAGLLLDMAGVGLIYFFGIQSKLSLSGAVNMEFNGTNYKEKRKAHRYQKYSHVGLALIFLGFSIQMLAQVISPDITMMINTQRIITTFILIPIICIACIKYINWTENKIVFKFSYIPQYKDDLNVISYDHLWTYLIRNETRKRQSFEFILPRKTIKASVYSSKSSSSEVKNDFSGIKIDDFDPDTYFFIRVFHIGLPDGEDAKLLINGKFYNPTEMSTKERAG